MQSLAVLAEGQVATVRVSQAVQAYLVLAVEPVVEAQVPATVPLAVPGVRMPVVFWVEPQEVAAVPLVLVVLAHRVVMDAAMAVEAVARPLVATLEAQEGPLEFQAEVEVAAEVLKQELAAQALLGQ